MAAASQVWTDVGQVKAVTLATTDATQKFIGWGSGTTAAAVTQTALVTPNAEARTSGTMSNPSGSILQVTGSITATGTRVVEEVAVFDASTNGNMIIRATHGQLNLVTGDIVTYTFSLTHKDSSE